MKTAKQEKHKIIPLKKNDSFGYLITKDLRKLQNAKQQQNERINFTQKAWR